MFLLDMATTTVAHGKIEVYDRRKKPMPLGWAVDENGKGTTDASTFERMFLSTDQYGGHLFLGGEGEENGGHKGYGLGLLVDLLCAGLSMGAFSLNTFKPGQGSGIAHFFGAFRLDLFGKTEDIRAHIAEILRTVRESEVAEGNKRIYIHGEKEGKPVPLPWKRGLMWTMPLAVCFRSWWMSSLSPLSHGIKLRKSGSKGLFRPFEPFFTTS